MNKLLFSLLALLVTGTALAGEAKVTWQDPDHYTDINPTNETRAGFRARVFKGLDEVFDSLAKELPDGYKLQVTVTDLDLAGDVKPMRGPGGQDIRVVKDIDWPKMSFSYVLSDSQDKQVAAGNEDLKDINFRSSVKINTGGSFYYEENLLKDWFKKQQEKKIFPVR
ncbi:DUF3016 domain-containing protein [Undibacterium terreum]|uniref:DUF3016 domain-containing protein n=1 Tax=Undibacterium terreum TaxID=1224302 RepID=A0A916U482_9BURK|nr:DUF3016 domain-containing protein [Undibacterium terreum]GGC59014.1 hypothetical protein GCM10011396_02400 [Undibacterium terreum]